MFKEGWCVRLGQEEVVWERGETVWNILKGVEQKRGEETKILKTGEGGGGGGGGGAGSSGGCLKKRGIGTPLQTITKEKLKKQIENVTEPAKKIFGIVLYCST